MGAEESWQNRLPRRRWLAQQHDRGEPQGNRSRMLLIAGVVLGLVAALLARVLPADRQAAPRVATVDIVVAAAPIGFGEALRVDQLKLVALPAAAVPKGSFQRLEALTMAPGRTAMRPIAVNEILIESALVVGAARLSTAPLLNPSMRAMTVPVNEVAGVGGLVAPGDRVDVFMTHEPEDALPHAELVAQAVRVLAIGSNMNIDLKKPGAAKSATLELTPLQAQKLSLALATGEISLALRQFSDDRRVRLPSVQVMDLNDGTTTRLVRKPDSNTASPLPGPAATARPAPRIIVMRGGVATPEPVLP